MKVLDYLRKPVFVYLSTLASVALNGCDNHTELTQIVNDNAIVKKKEHVEKVDNLATGIGYGFLFNNVGAGIIGGAITSKPEQYNITFEGERIFFTLNDSTIYSRFKETDPVSISYSIRKRPLAGRNIVDTTVTSVSVKK